MRPAAELIDTNDAKEWVTYEQPLNERMRTFLRLNFLFDQAEFHAQGSSTWQSRAAVASLLDVLAILTRGDVRQDVIKELERYSAGLMAFRSDPGVDRERLNHTLDEIAIILSGLEASGNTILQELKESDFLNAVRNRSAIPGGTCEFDLPEYRHWLSLSYEKRVSDFNAWLSLLAPMRQGVSKVLWLLRESSDAERQVARSGMYQHVLERGVSVQLLRISLLASHGVYPEISGNQHRFTVRFQSWQDVSSRSAQSTDDIEFKLACC